MSRGDGRALERAAEAVREAVGGRPDEEEWPWFARVAVDGYLDALLSELPEEAVGAARRAYRKGDLMDETIRAFLLSLRSSSRGPADGE